MNDYMKMSLDELANDILEDGIIDADEVKHIRERIYEDGIIDREEADFLFKLNDGVSGKNNDPSWKNLFVEAIAKYVLEDEVSPGIIDEDEADWLVARIEGDETYDENEKALLLHIKKNAKKIHDKLQSKMELHNID